MRIERIASITHGFSFTVFRFLPHHKYGRRFISGIPGFSSFLVYSNIPQTNCSNKSHVYVSIFASRTPYEQRAGLDNVLVQYPTAFRTFFAEELLNRQVLVGYLLLSYNDNLLRRKRKKTGCCNFTREKSTSYPEPQAKADFQFFFDVALLMMTSPLFLCFQCVLFYN